MKHFCRHISVDSLMWESAIGVKNAAWTGMLTGTLWAAKGEFIGLLSKWIRLKTMPRLNVVPTFQSPYTKTRLECMLHFRIGYAIIAGLKIVRFWKENHQNVSLLSQTINIILSNRRLDSHVGTSD